MSLVQNWRFYDSERKQREVGQLVQEISQDEGKLARLGEELVSLKDSANHRGKRRDDW